MILSQEKIENLLKEGFDVNTKDDFHDTLLHHAKNEDITQFLIKSGADVNIQNKTGYIPLHLAKTEGQVKALISAGSKINVIDFYSGYTPLHLFCQKDFFEGIKLLLEAGAYVNVQNDGGNTPLHYATHNKIKKILIKFGADTTIKNNLGELHDNET